MSRLAPSLAPLLLASLVACGDSGGAGGGGEGGTGSSASDTTSSAGGAGSTASSTATGTGSTTGTTSATTSTGAGGSSTGCFPSLAAGHADDVPCDGGIDYDLEIPATCLTNACGLIVDMHGFTMSADAQDANTGMRALGQARGYVVIQPTAPTNNFGVSSWDLDAHPALVRAVIEDIAGQLPIDPARIHAMGFSQGGGMTWRMVCDHADLFASVAPIGAVRSCSFSGDDLPSEEVDVLAVHGRNDTIVNFQSDGVGQRDDALDGWPFGAPTQFVSEADHDATRWTTAGGTVLEFWEHDYESSDLAVIVPINGHCVPGGEDFGGALATGYSCEDEGTFVFGELAMDFFEAHPKD